MKVKDTHKIDLVYATRIDKLLNFIHGHVRYTDSNNAVRYIKDHFPGWQYNGVAPFEEVIMWCEEHFGNDWFWNFVTIYFKYERYRTACL